MGSELLCVIPGGGGKWGWWDSPTMLRTVPVGPPYNTPLNHPMKTLAGWWDSPSMLRTVPVGPPYCLPTKLP
jgi:hypothetical protein